MRKSLAGARVDIDDRGSKDFRNKIKAAQLEWVPAYALVGRKERESNILELKTRGKEMAPYAGRYSAEGLRQFSQEKMGEMPFIDLYHSPMISKQIRFRGSY